MLKQAALIVLSIALLFGAVVRGAMAAPHSAVEITASTEKSDDCAAPDCCPERGESCAMECNLCSRLGAFAPQIENPVDFTKPVMGITRIDFIMVHPQAPDPPPPRA